MKKLIKTGINLITFSLLPMVAIASNPSSSPTSDSSQFRLTQSFQTKLKKSFKNSKWVEQTQSNSGSNIIDGQQGTIFEDSCGNLWSMGKGAPLQKYNYDTRKWIVETNGNNITNGNGGTIFEDSRGNLWSMGAGTKLQKYNYTTGRWNVETNGSNIIDGHRGTIFEDSRGNLWSMSNETPLQKYNYQTKRWTTETNDIIRSSGSNIIDGYGGTIFEDSRGNLWSMGYETPLQKYNYQTKRWTIETGSGNNITNGNGGTIFEDSRGNLWSMGKGTSLQKYNYNTKKWTSETSDEEGSSGSNITDGGSGTIFEDSRGNLWSMGKGTSLQKYNYNTKKWTVETHDGIESSDSKIIDGEGGTIFEDSRGNLWSMSNGTPLQKYNYQTKRWTTETNDIIRSSGSNITDGYGGTIFEDSRGNLWSMGLFTSLQKLTPIEETNPNDQKAKDFDIEFKTRINIDSKIAISIKGYQKYTSSLFTHLQYKKKTESNWKIVTKRTMILENAEYQFKWVLGTEEILAKEQRLPQDIIIKNNGSIKTIAPILPIDIVKVKTFLSKLSSIDINSLVNPTKLVSAVTEAEILEQIKASNDYSKLTNAQKALITKNLITKTNDPNGTLKVTINYEEKSYIITANGFLKVANNDIAKVKAFFSSLSNLDISSLVVSNKLVSAVTKVEILNKIKLASGYSELTNDQQAQITKGLITKTNDPNGTLKVTINYEGQSYIIIANGFLKVSNADIAKVKAFLFNVSNSDLSSLAIATKLVSAVTKAEILEQIKATSGYSKLNNVQKAVITTNLITKANEPDGTLRVRMTYESDTHEIMTSGFLKVANDNIAKVKTFLSSLSISNFSPLSDANKLVGIVTKTEILEKIKLARGYKTLNQAQKALVTKSLITKAEDAPGTLKITISFESESYEFNILGFKITTAQNKKKVKDFLGALPSTLVDSLSDSTKLVSAVTKAEILNKIKKASGYSSLAPAEQGLIIEDLITIANDPDGTLKVIILFDGETYEHSKNGFKLSSVHNIEQVKAFLGGLDNSSISSLATTTKLVSQVTKTEILTKIKATSGYSALSNAQKALVAENLITKSEEPDGTLKVIVNYEGEQYNLNVSGFLKVTDHNIAKVKAFLSSLSNSNLSSLTNDAKLVSQVTKTEILAKIKLASGYSDLTNEQKALITTNLMTKTNEPDGTLKVTINYEGHKYELIASGFLKVVDDNIAKIKTFLSSLSNSNLSSLANATKLVGAITKTEILEKIKLARGYKDLNQVQKALLIEGLITKAEDAPGTLKITISFESESYEFNILGFKITTTQNKKKVKDFLGALPSTLVDSLSDSTKLVSAVTKAEILTKIKETGGYSSLAPAEQGLIIEDLITIANDPDGTLKVTILFDGETYEHSKGGFKLSSVHNIEQVKAFLGSLDDSSISSLAIATKPVSLVTKTEILEQIKATSGYNTLTNAQKALITTNLITKSEEPKKTLKVAINFESESYELNASGFLKAADHNIAEVKMFLGSLDNSDISSLAIATKPVSQVTKAEILEKIKAASCCSGLTNTQKELITNNLITKFEEPEGTLKVRIAYESDKYELIAGGFLTVAANNIAKVKAFLNTLSSQAINSLVDSSKLVSTITKLEVLTLIQAASGYSDLTSDQQALITGDLIFLSKDPDGALKVMITFKGKTYELIKDGFKLTLKAEANKFKDFASTDSIKSNAASLKASSKNVLNIFEKISGYQRPANLANDISITKATIKNALNSQTRKVTFELTIARQGEKVKKDVVVTFKASKIIPTPTPIKKESSKKDSSGLSTGAIVGIALGSIFGIGIIVALIFYLFRRNKK